MKIIALEWYVPHYTPSLEEYNNIANQITKKMPTKPHYSEKSVFMKEFNTQNFWTFELGTQEGIKVPIWIFVIFKQSDRELDQNVNNDIFIEFL